MLTRDHPTACQAAVQPLAVTDAEITLTKKAPRPLTIFRYLAVGACNTAFGYGCFALFTLLLTPVFSYGYILASLLANLLSISFAFFGYKWFVFRTRGNYLKEWIRCVGVYAGSMVLSAAALPFVVGLIRRQPGHERSAPYIAGAIVLAFSVVFSFFGHRHISFAEGLRANENDPVD